MSLKTVLDNFRETATSNRDLGDKFERLMKAFLLTDPKYAFLFTKVWLWNEFPGKNDLGGNDTGIDLVALTNQNDYWAIQCKCYEEDSSISKGSIDGFISTSTRSFTGEDFKTHSFSQLLWIDTTGKAFGTNAHEVTRNQSVPFLRLGTAQLTEAPVDWEKLHKAISGLEARISNKQLRPHQTVALTKTNEYFKANDRGKLIMACGTGKTFNSLRIAEKETNGSGLVLFLVPSIALLGQTLNEWYAEAEAPINAICICSDPEITKQRKQLEDIDTTSVVDLAYPASTNVESILRQFKGLETSSNKGLTVVFSTYQSIEVIAKAQKALEKTIPAFAQFDLIICDEAHRTTGVSLADEDESAFTKVHNNDFIKAKKRLYMTATPRLYDADTKSKAAKADAVLCSMDDVHLYGEEIYRIGFGEAVEKGLLTDYKVLILTLNEKDVPPAVQKMIMDKESEINTDDASKLIGCINALSKQILGDEGILKETDPEPMRRAVAFCQSIKVSNKITNTFNAGSGSYISQLPSEKQNTMQVVASKHIDGTMNATVRGELLTWLKDEPKENECRVLTNVRCLSEGVDVPSLDAVLFLSARNSQVDVVQSVGRVMRKSPGKKYGYIIIPIVVPSDIEADKALDDNERYKVVWTVLNALRAHDDRFNATVNKIELNKNRPEQILVGRPETSFDKDGNPIYPKDNDNGASSKNISEQISLQFEQLQSVVFARMVQKVGDRRYWEQWAKSVADIATRQTERITRIITENPKYRQAFDDFLKGLHKNINPSIAQSDAIEMLSQHIITKPVFDALFDDYSFVKNNPMSKSMQKMLDLLEEQSLEKDAEVLQKFYESVKMRASGIDNAEGKQRIIIELYDKFFKTAFPKLVEKLGIVYTPIEVVDFIIHSVNDILLKEFGRSISDENVHILDPFTGTGTFITRLLQSGLIKPEDLSRKYKHEIHANEIVLLAYYIAAVNIENTFHDLCYSPPLEEFLQDMVVNSPLDGANSPFDGTNSPPLEGCQTQFDGVVHEVVDNGVFINNIPIRRNFVENLPYNGSLSQLAKDKRKAGILSEVLFWQQVHKGKFHNIDFDRQRIIGSYIVDFYVKTLGLVIEIDGSSHDNKAEYDAERQAYLESLELKVYRITDADVKKNIGVVMLRLEAYIIAEFRENPPSCATPPFGHPSTGGELSIPYTPPVEATSPPVEATSPPVEGCQTQFDGVAQYQPFEGICLTDTFQLGESQDGEKLFSEMFPQNSERVQSQQKVPLRIIMGNPPYSVGQNEANDNAKNQSYYRLDNRISATYAKLTKATNKNSLYDSYIKAFRWSTDRLCKEGGIICFVSNGAWLDGNSTDGFRKTLEEEFDAIYVFNLRGNQRTSGELSRKEGGKIFGSGSRTPIAITLLVKNPDAKFPSIGGVPEGRGGATIGGVPEGRGGATIHYHDIGDYLDQKQKLALITKYGSFVKLPLTTLHPNEQSDWIGQRSDRYMNFFPIFDKENLGTPFFLISSNGMVTSRDAWVLNFSKTALTENITRTINFFNSQVDLFKAEREKNLNLSVDIFMDKDAKNISWSSSLIPNLEKGNKTFFDSNSFRNAIYRPFNKQNLYWGDKMIHRRAKFNSLFPNQSTQNIVIVSCGGISNEKSTIISNCIVDLHAYGDSQCFPLYYYEENNRKQKNLFDASTGSASEKDYIRRDAISDFILERARKQYGLTTPAPPKEGNFTQREGNFTGNITKEDIFYYVYGFLHSKEYRETFANDLKKMLPRLPLVEDVQDFWKFSKAGRKLAELHLNYETVPPCPGVVVLVNPLSMNDTLGQVGNPEMEYLHYRVQKMRFPRKGDKSSIIYNAQITVENIPPQAYEYVVNGKSAIEWIMERYQITTHKESGIVNNPNDWASETNKPRYILDLLMSVINVSIQTVAIVNRLPKIDFK